MSIAFDRLIDLDESLSLLGQSPDVRFFEDAAFLTTSFRGRLAVHGPTGVQSRLLGRSGEGPGEYSDPRFIAIRGDTVVVVDASRIFALKYLRDGTYLEHYPLSFEGSPMIEYYNGLLIRYLKSGKRSNFISIYDTKLRRMVRSYGWRNSDHDALAIHGFVSGGVLAWKDNIYFTSPDKPEVCFVSVRLDQEPACFAIPDDQYIALPYTGESKNRQDRFEYAKKRSITGNILSVAEHLVVHVSEGVVPRVGVRETKLFFFDSQHRFVDVISLENFPWDDVWVPTFLASNGNSLFYIEGQSNTDGASVQHRLAKWDIRFISHEDD